MTLATPAAGGLPGANGTNGVGFTLVSSGTFQTTDGNIQTLITWTPPTLQSVAYELWIKGYDTPNDLGIVMIRRFGIQRASSGPTIINGGFLAGESGKTGALSSASTDLTTSGNNVVSRLLGVTAHTIDWTYQLFSR